VGSGPNGVIVAQNVNKLFVGLTDSNVAVVDIDPSSARANTVIAKLNTGGKARADELDYDPEERKIYVANSDDQFVTVIDAAQNAILKRIDVPGGAIEQPRYNPADGMVYLTGSEDNVVYKFDPKTDTMVSKTDVIDKCNPNGLAINPKTNQALLGCSSRVQPQHAVAWDIAAGKVINTFNQAGAGDMTLYDDKVDRFFFAASNFFRGGQMAIFRASDPIAFQTNIPTAVGSHAVAFEETNNIVYTQDQLPGEASLFSFPLPNP
jgi:YVTN family beta-propeller protein